jgi:hypothetical protein
MLVLVLVVVLVVIAFPVRTEISVASFPLSLGADIAPFLNLKTSAN